MNTAENKLDDGQEETQSYMAKGVSGFLVVLFINWLFPNVIPFGTFEFWKWDKANIIYGTLAGWPILVWGLILNLFFLWKDWNNPPKAPPKEILYWGVRISLWAGLSEEICFRWTIFLCAIVLAKISNWFALGFMGLGIPEHFYLWIVGPIANITTLGYLRSVLFHPASWAVGAAVIASNAFFRDGHKYQGPFGWIDSWFFGMFCFWLLFKHGLVPCIVVHAVYDIFVFVFGAFEAWLKILTGRRIFRYYHLR